MRHSASMTQTIASYVYMRNNEIQREMRKLKMQTEFMDTRLPKFYQFVKYVPKIMRALATCFGVLV